MRALALVIRKSGTSLLPLFSLLSLAFVLLAVVSTVAAPPELTSRASSLSPVEPVPAVSQVDPVTPVDPVAPVKTGRAPRRASTVLEIDNLSRGDLQVKGFELSAPTRIRIQAVGYAPAGCDQLSSYCWIIDAETREPVMTMEAQDCEDFGRGRRLREYDERLKLPAGRYEAHYYVGPANILRVKIDFDDIDDFAEVMEEIGEALEELGEDLAEVFEEIREEFRDEVRRFTDKEHLSQWHNAVKKSAKHFEISDRDLSELGILIVSSRPTFSTYDPDERRKERQIVGFTRVGDDERLRSGFTLEREMKLEVRACGEYSDGASIFVDQGWLTDANTGERIWQMDKWSTSYAGGARKNRCVAETITLPAGDYLAYYMTDGSHSYEYWNSPPPHDPRNYGLTVGVASQSDLASAKTFKYNPRDLLVFALDRMRADSYASQGFALEDDTRLKILAYGEFAWDDFVDYGWIEDLETLETIWEMTEDNTHHAGGSTKNRVFDDAITLPAGSYMAHYITDGSHNYRSWNADKPFEPKKWGLSIYGVGKSFKRDDISLFDEAPEDGRTLASLVRLGDDVEISESFTLDSPTIVRIIALGEGGSGEMCDYGWIEERDSGRKVWKMKYRATRHAGGAEKNRLVNVTLKLDSGDYRLVFVTDGSHSFGDFNARAPHNSQRWGITVSKKQ